MAGDAMLFLCNKVFVLNSLDNIITVISTHKYTIQMMLKKR